MRHLCNTEAAASNSLCLMMLFLCNAIYVWVFYFIILEMILIINNTFQITFLRSITTNSYQSVPDFFIILFWLTPDESTHQETFQTWKS